jgi:hypothetical protein
VGEVSSILALFKVCDPLGPWQSVSADAMHSASVVQNHK